MSHKNAKKNLYILKPYIKLSLLKKMLTAQCLRRKFEGWGGGGGAFVSHTPPPLTLKLK